MIDIRKVIAEFYGTLQYVIDQQQKSQHRANAKLREEPENGWD